MSFWQHGLHGAHSAEHSNPRGAAILYIVIGFFFAPLLIGVPVMIYGFYRLFK